MKNLNVFRNEKANLDIPIVGHCIDADNGRLLLVASNLEVYEVQGNHSEHSPARLIETDLDHQSSGLPASLASKDVLSIDFIVESGSVLVVLRGGEFIRIGVSSFSPPSACVHVHPRHLSSIRLSPDQDLLALADDNNEVSILSSDFSVNHVTNALAENDSVNKPVGVGWGSKETQFFGLDGRPSKEKHTDEKIVPEEGELENINKIELSDLFQQFRSQQRRNTVLDWRGDGQYLATLTYIPESDKHYLKVWNRVLQLQYMSEQLVTMERGLISWIPNGQYVCCAQRRDNRINEIAMFEKNGMVHQRVTLPSFMPYMYIRDLLWSPDSKVLAIIVVQFSPHSRDARVSFRHILLLYTMQNFHYYLKYTSILSDGTCNRFFMRWNPIHHNILYIASDSGQCVEYDCTLVVEQCRDESTIVVVDSNKLLVTPFKICNIPPPMSAFKIELEATITRLILNPKSLADSFVLTSGGRLHYFTKNDLTTSRSSSSTSQFIDNKYIKPFVEKLGNLDAIEFKYCHDLQNITPLSDSLMVATRQRGSDCELYRIEIIKPEARMTVIKTIEKHQVVSIVKDSYQASTQEVTLLLEDSSCVQFNLSTQQSTIRFTMMKTAMGQRLFIKETQFLVDYGVVISLTLDSTLRVNDHTLANNCCTSFKCSKNYLVYTTTEHVINFIPLDRLTSEQMPDDLGAWTQPIESGGTLVSVCEDDSKVILQMPRGNLEILHPRIMVLLRLTNYIDSHDYLSAMKMARRYRVDLNFICDYMLRRNVQGFYNDTLNTLANSIADHDPALLNLLIAELGHDDTVLGRYKSIMMYLPREVGALELEDTEISEQKVNRICTTIELPHEARYLQSRLLCLLKQEPRKSADALLLIHAIQEKSEREAALKFILYFISIEQLFLDAISTYDTDIALMVASGSSKDPKEYLALLDNFNSTDNIKLRRYMMDSHIKNYERAFTNLLAYLQDCTEDKQAIKAKLVDLVVSKRIYKHAIKDCFDQYVDFIQTTSTCCGIETTFSELCVEIWTKYGDYLLEKRHYLEAGLAYLKSMITHEHFEERILENVIKCYSLANEWDRCVAVLERFPALTSARRADLLERISKSIYSQGDITDAIFVLHMRKDDNHALQLVSSRRWHLAEAIATAEAKSRLYDEISRGVSGDLDDVCAELQTEIRDARGHFERLKQLMLMPQKSGNYDHGGDCINADSLSTVDGSETTSVTMSATSLKSRAGGRAARSGAPSIATRASSKSSKSQAKKKKIQLKVGSRHEDMALVAELQKFVKNQRLRQEFVVRLLAAQVEFHPSSQPPASQSSLANELLTQRHKLAGEILETLWPKSEAAEESVLSVYKRFGKLFATGESVDNDEVSLLLKPDFPTHLSLFDF